MDVVVFGYRCNHVGIFFCQAEFRIAAIHVVKAKRLLKHRAVSAAANRACRSALQQGNRKVQRGTGFNTAGSQYRHHIPPIASFRTAFKATAVTRDLRAALGSAAGH